MALAVLYGSSGSRGGGRLAVLTEQNLQPRVHVSPINYGMSKGNQNASVREEILFERPLNRDIILVCL